MVEGIGPHPWKKRQGHRPAFALAAGRNARATRMPNSGGGRECRSEETDVLHVPYFQYDGVGGVIGTLGRVRYPVQDGVVRGELSVSGGLTGEWLRALVPTFAKKPRPPAFALPRAGMPAPHGMSKSARECRAEGVSWLHVSYFQYDGLGG